MQRTIPLRVLLLSSLLVTCFLQLHAQERIVKSMELLPNDATAMTFENQRQDLNENFAGIVKVLLAIDGAKFEGGGVLEQTKHEAGEYWVWLAKDSKRIKVYAPGYIPLELNFNEAYGIKIESKRTYQMVLTCSLVGVPQSDN